jgi:hypothetical protein
LLRSSNDQLGENAMNEIPWQERVSKRVLPLQIIVAALVAGCTFFLVIALVVPPGQGRDAAGDAAQPQLMLTWIGLAFVAAIVVARAVVPTVIVRTGRRRIAQGTFQLPQPHVMSQGEGREPLEELSNAGPLFMLYQTKTIIGAALFEGATFFMIVVYLVERQTLALGIAIALILAVAAHMPTRTGVVHWIDDQLRFVDDERSLGR